MPLRQAAALMVRRQHRNATADEQLDLDANKSLSASPFAPIENEGGSVQPTSPTHHGGPCSLVDPVPARRGRPRATKPSRYRLSSSETSDTPTPRKRKSAAMATPDPIAAPKTRKKRIARNAKGGKGRKRHQCGWPDCGKTFATAGHLSRHTRIHVGVKPFQCPFEGCESTFARQDNMRQVWIVGFRYLCQ